MVLASDTWAAFSAPSDAPVEAATWVFAAAKASSAVFFCVPASVNFVAAVLAAL